MREGRIVQCVRALVFVTVLVLSGDNALAQQAAQLRARVGIVMDGDSEATREILSAYRDEIIAFFGTEHGIEFDERAVVAADWTAAGASAAIDRLFEDPRVDVVLALGPIGSNELARRPMHAKPAIAAAIVDGRLQQLPLRDGASGVRNLTYIDAASSTTRMLEQFRTVVPFRSLGILVNEGLPEAIPALRDAVESQSAAANVVAHIIPVASSGVVALAALRADVDAVYLGPLDRLSPAAYDSLLNALQQRGLPAFTVLGRPGVERGALAAFAPRDDLERRARRAAVDLQRILSGEDAGTLPVGLAAIPELTLNMATARAIGFAPEWQVLIEADLINQELPAEGRQWSIATAAREAMRVHSDVRAAEYDVAAGNQEVRRARSALLPQLSATTTGSLVRESTAAASFGQQPERSLTGSLTLSQCEAMSMLINAWVFADSMEAAERAARRGLVLQPRSAAAWRRLADVLDLSGRFDDAADALRNAESLDELSGGLGERTRHFIRAGDFAQADALLQHAAETSPASRLSQIWFLQAMSLRHQGRLSEALRAARQFRAATDESGSPAGAAPPAAFLEAQVLLESGRARDAAMLFDSVSRWFSPGEPASNRAARRVWGMMLQASALAEAGMFGALPALADSAEHIGKLSYLARDHRLHHHIRGLAAAGSGQDEVANAEFRTAIYSSTTGGNRTNHELAKVLLRQGRAGEAIAVLRPIVRGAVLDGSNLHLTLTQAHLLLARAFDAGGQRDSALAHYQRVTAAWQRAEPPFATLRSEAQQRITILQSVMRTRADASVP